VANFRAVREKHSTRGVRREKETEDSTEGNKGNEDGRKKACVVLSLWVTGLVIGLSKRAVLSAITVALIASAPAPQTNVTVVLTGYENQNGNQSLGTFRGPGEAQQLYRGSALAAVWPMPVLINSLSFRVQEGDLAYNGTITSLEIRLSTSSRTPERMSVQWANNAGEDVKTVFSHNNIPILATGTSPVNPFEVTFQLDQPFEYDPAAGSLAMYLRLGGTETYDGSKLVDGNSSALFGYLDTSTPVVSSRGLVTEFGWIPIPEPSAGSLTCIFVFGPIPFKKLRLG
jgi:hypothetical protein